MDGMDPLDFLRVLHQGQFIWDACRKQCAALYTQRGEIGIAREILTNEDGQLIDGRLL